MNNEISVKDLISSIKKKGLLQSIPQLEQIYQFAIEVEKKLAESEAKCVQLAAENVQIKAMNDCLSEELRGYESDGAFEGPKMHLLWWQVKTPVTDAFLAGIKADGVEMFVEKCREESMRAISSDIRNNWWLAGEHAEDFASQLREVAK